MTQSKKSVSAPTGFHTVTPALTVKDTDKAIWFYKRAFGAEERMRFMGPDEKSIMHAEIKIGDSIIMLGEEHSETGCRGPQSFGGTPVSFYLYVEDADQAFARAVSAGAKADTPVADMFWGDRCGQLIDPFGHKWSLATRKENLTPEEMRKRSGEFFAQMALQAR
jgi:PhnB protein